MIYTHEVHTNMNIHYTYRGFRVSSPDNNIAYDHVPSDHVMQTSVMVLLYDLAVLWFKPLSLNSDALHSGVLKKGSRLFRSKRPLAWQGPQSPLLDMLFGNPSTPVQSKSSLQT